MQIGEHGNKEQQEIRKEVKKQSKNGKSPLEFCLSRFGKCFEGVSMMEKPFHGIPHKDFPPKMRKTSE